MSYCDDCILVDICGKEGCCDEAMTFCVDKNKFIHVSTLDKIRAEIEQYQSDAFYSDNVMINKRIILEIIDKYREEQTDV